jgi:hypothetical protein
MKQRVAAVGSEVVLTEQWGAAFRLAPGELLRTFWMGQLYDGPAIPEYHDSIGDKAGRFAKQAASALVGTKVRYLKVQIYLALTTQGRLVVGRNAQAGADDHDVTPHSEWVPGSQVYFAQDLQLVPGDSPAMENGYRGRVHFLMFGTEPGARLPVWIPEDAAAAIATWRVPQQV